MIPERRFAPAKAISRSAAVTSQPSGHVQPTESDALLAMGRKPSLRSERRELRRWFRWTVITITGGRSRVPAATERNARQRTGVRSTTLYLVVRTLYLGVPGVRRLPSAHFGSVV